MPEVISKYKQVFILGTSHISSSSVRTIRTFCKDHEPDIIAVELDKQRLHGLLHDVPSRARISDIRRIGLKGFLFAVIGSWVQKKLGKIVDLKPGSDMKAAALIAIKEKKSLALIDQDIEKTLRRFSKTLSWREKWQFVKDIFSFTFFKKREMKRMGLHDIDLSKVPPKELIIKLIDELKAKYPNVYKVLIEERNKHMASAIKKMMEQNPDKKIFVVVGAGHVQGLLEELKLYK